MRFQKEHRIEIPTPRFFELMFDTAYIKRMNLEAMNVQSYEPISHKVDGDAWVMFNKVTPQDNMPGFLKKIIGTTFSYEEETRHQKGSDTATVTMTPNVMRDKVKMAYRLRAVPDGDSACRRIMEWEIEVKIFGVGGQIEKFAAGEIERGMDNSARFMNAHRNG